MIIELNYHVTFIRNDFWCYNFCYFCDNNDYNNFNTIDHPTTNRHEQTVLKHSHQHVFHIYIHTKTHFLLSLAMFKRRSIEINIFIFYLIYFVFHLSFSSFDKNIVILTKNQAEGSTVQRWDFVRGILYFIMKWHIINCPSFILELLLKEKILLKRTIFQTIYPRTISFEHITPSNSK